MGSIWQTIQSSLSGGAGGHVIMIVGAIIAAIVAGVAWFWAKHPVRWILALVTVGVILLVVLNQANIPNREDLDPGLPDAFKPPGFSWWVLVLTLAASTCRSTWSGPGYAVVAASRARRRASRSSRTWSLPGKRSGSD